MSPVQSFMKQSFHPKFTISSASSLEFEHNCMNYLNKNVCGGCVCMRNNYMHLQTKITNDTFGGGEIAKLKIHFETRVYWWGVSINCKKWPKQICWWGVNRNHKEVHSEMKQTLHIIFVESYIISFGKQLPTSFYSLLSAIVMFSLVRLCFQGAAVKQHRPYFSVRGVTYIVRRFQIYKIVFL